MYTNSEKMLMGYKQEIYDTLEGLLNGSLTKVGTRGKLRHIKKNIENILSFSSDAEKENLEKICKNEMNFITEALDSEHIKNYITAEKLEKLKKSIVSNDKQTSNEKSDNDNEEKKEDLNKIHVKRVSEIEEMLKDLNLSYEYFIKDRDDVEDLEKQKNILNRYLNEFNAINKELAKITNKTVKNTKNVLPNVKNEDDRKRWEQENRELLNKINSLIPDVQNPLLSLKKEIVNIEDAIKRMEENEEVLNEEVESDKSDKQDGNVLENEENMVTEEQYYDNLAKSYVEEENSKEEIPYELFDVDESVQEEETTVLEDTEKVRETVGDDNSSQTEEIPDVHPEEDGEQVQENEIDKRIKRYVNFSKFGSINQMKDKLDSIEDYISENIDENPKTYREIRKVFKRIFYDEMDFNGDRFTADLFANGKPKYISGKMTQENFETLDKGIEMYKQISTEGKIPQNEIETFDKFVLAPYELKKAIIEKRKEQYVEENEMFKDLKSQTVYHEDIDEDDFEIVDEDEFEIIDEDNFEEVELEEEDLKR